MASKSNQSDSRVILVQKCFFLDFYLFLGEISVSFDLPLSIIFRYSWRSNQFQVG